MSARAVGTVLIGNQTVVRSDIRRLPECALPQDDASWAAARASLERDGFVLIRDAFDADTIAKCRATMLAQVQRRGGIDLAAAKERGDPALGACAPIARTADGKRLQAGWTTDALVSAAASVAPIVRRLLTNFQFSLLHCLCSLVASLITATRTRRVGPKLASRRPSKPYSMVRIFAA